MLVSIVLRIIFVFLVLLWIPTIVSGGNSDEYVTLFRDEFDAKDPHWYYEGTMSGTVTLRDGYLFQNVTAHGHATLIDDPGTRSWVKKGMHEMWLYTNVEYRLRCFDEDLSSEVGSGYKGQGFSEDFYPDYWLGIFSLGPRSDPPFSGLWTQSKTFENGTHNISKTKLDTAEIDIRDWHT